MAISPDNRWILTGNDDFTARLWDLRTKDPAANPVVLRGHDGPVYAVAISPDSRRVLTGSDDNTVRLWDLSAKDPAAQRICDQFDEHKIGKTGHQRTGPRC